jgi:glutathione S-transferase
MLEILIGTRLWSSWSMRPWLALKRTGAPFKEVLVPLREHATSDTARKAGSPSGLVPVLRDGPVTVWDSLAICEYLAECFPEARLWPADRVARALGRSAAAEMHAGFAGLRGECPMHLGLRTRLAPSEATAADLERVVALWNGLLERFGGPFLLGDWSIADAFFTPVATRIESYGLNLAEHGDAGAAHAYAGRLLEQPEYQAWEAAALAAMA